MRDSYWDIIKGLGIIFVVMAHSYILIQELNWFHLELFFFVSGFLFKAEKCLDYGAFFLHKLKTLWKPFVLYNVICLAFQDLFISINWLSTENVPGTVFANWIGIYELHRYIVATICVGAVSPMCGATWFMAPFLSNILLFAIAVKVTYKKSPLYLPLTIILLFIVGVALCKHSPGCTMYVDMAMMLLPITAAGFYLKKFCIAKNIHVKQIFSNGIAGGGIIISLIIFGFLKHEGKFSGLGGYSMGNWFYFIIAAFSGIYLTMILARIISMSDLTTKFFAYIGRESFHIMALHFFGFRILSTLYVIFSDSDLSLLKYYMLPQISIYIYVIFGVGIPLLFRKIYDLVERKLA